MLNGEKAGLSMLYINELFFAQGAKIKNWTSKMSHPNIQVT